MQLILLLLCSYATSFVHCHNQVLAHWQCLREYEPNDSGQVIEAPVNEKSYDTSNESSEYSDESSESDELFDSYLEPETITIIEFPKTDPIRTGSYTRVD